MYLIDDLFCITLYYADHDTLRKLEKLEEFSNLLNSPQFLHSYLSRRIKNYHETHMRDTWRLIKYSNEYDLMMFDDAIIETNLQKSMLAIDEADKAVIAAYPASVSFFSLSKRKYSFYYCFEIFLNDDIEFLKYTIAQLEMLYSTSVIKAFLEFHIHFMKPKIFGWYVSRPDFTKYGIFDTNPVQVALGTMIQMCGINTKYHGIRSHQTNRFYDFKITYDEKRYRELDKYLEDLEK